MENIFEVMTIVVEETDEFNVPGIQLSLETRLIRGRVRSLDHAISIKSIIFMYY